MNLNSEKSSIMMGNVALQRRNSSEDANFTSCMKHKSSRTRETNASSSYSTYQVMHSPGEVRIRKNSLNNKEPYTTLWPNLPILSLPLLHNSAQLMNLPLQSSTSKALNRKEPSRIMPQGAESWQTRPTGTRVLRKHSSDSDLRIRYEEQSPLFQTHPKDT